MRIIIIEDEAIAMRLLRKTILSVNPGIEIVAGLDSVADARLWFSENKGVNIDLIFSDIQLSDGLAFEIFEKLGKNYPIIFTTAFNEYAIKAFKVNGIDYLLKPIQESDVRNALSKFEMSKEMYSQLELKQIQQFMLSFQAPQPPQPTFLAYQKDKIIPIQSENMAWIYTQNQIVTAVMQNNQKYHLNEKLEDIEKRLPVLNFFRINRQYIIARKSIVEAEFYFNNRLSLKLNPPALESVIVSREKVSQFRNWLQGM